MPNKFDVKYISAIDGLRTIAVMAVVFFHAGFPWMRGGFVGVDVFFVISGFLITSNIVRDLDQHSWQFSQFYLKRIARLFPALFTVILLTIISAYFILGPDDLSRLGKSGVYANLSLSNFFFYSEAGYFDTLAETKPLLHTWSLAVEEQFYMVWPALIVFLYRIGVRGALYFGIASLSIVSLVASLYFYAEHPDMVFFLTPFRFYQFGLGALLAISGRAFQQSNNPLRAVAGFTGITIIVLLSIFLEGNENPAKSALLPAIAAAACIYSAETSYVKSFLANKVFLWIGQRSYSIYLVHWPLMVLLKLKTDLSFSFFEMITATILSIILGAVLHFLVERRFRFKHDFTIEKRARILAGTVISFILVFVTCTFYWGNAGYPERVPEELRKTASNLQPRWDFRQNALHTGTCNILLETDQVSSFVPATCMNPPADKPAYLIVGDSYASGAYLFFSQSYPDVYFGQLTIPGCRLRLPGRIDNKKCASLYEVALKELAIGKKFDGVILSSNWLDGHLYEIDELIKVFKTYNLDIILIGSRIRFKDRLPSIVLSSLNLNAAASRAQNLLKTEPFDLNIKLKKRFAFSAKYVDMISLQCPKDCDVFNADGSMLYLDDSHFSMEGVELISKRLRNSYPDLFSSPRPATAQISHLRKD